MAEILPFARRGAAGGLVYVVPTADPPEDASWLVYSQDEGEAEPDLRGEHPDVDAAIAAARHLAVRRGARLVVDFGGGAA